MGGGRNQGGTVCQEVVDRQGTEQSFQQIHETRGTEMEFRAHVEKGPENKDELEGDQSCTSTKLSF